MKPFLERAQIIEISKSVYDKAQKGEIPSWGLRGNGTYTPDQYLKVTDAHLGDKCDCGRKCDFLFEVELPVWFSEAAGLDVNISLAQDCLLQFAKTWVCDDIAALENHIKKELKRLRDFKKHGAIS